MQPIAYADMQADLPQLACPTLVRKYHEGQRAALRGRHAGLVADDPGFDKVERGAALSRVLDRRRRMG